MELKEALSRLEKITQEQPYPLLFATVSGAHLYGFPSADSDYDLRGVHILPKEETLGMKNLRETIEVSRDTDDLELDLVTHDVKKFFHLLLRPNGYVLEQLLSPIVIHTTKAHKELCEKSDLFFTRHHAHHYLGFSRNQWKLFQKDNPRRVKPLLYVYRTLLTGIFLMENEKLEANLCTLNERYRLSYLDELIEMKKTGAEREHLPDDDFQFHEKEYHRLSSELESWRDKTSLPEKNSGLDFLHELLLRLRIDGE